jgi:hypothetical protein
MIDEFDDVLWELSDPNLDYDLIEESAYQHGQIGIYENTWGMPTDHGKRKLGLTDSEQDFDYSNLKSSTEYHEDIKSAQKYRALIANELIPSKAVKTWWLYAESKKKYKKATKRSGKWLSFHTPEFIDAAWEQVKDATELGLLGGDSKCSTKKGWKGPGNDFVICIYQYDWRDEKDVMRIRDALRELGFTKPLSYKTDADTIAGKYSCNGAKNLSKYRE